jgi:RNA polymerase sigma-70 factor (ECF subfamily)
VSPTDPDRAAGPLEAEPASSAALPREISRLLRLWSSGDASAPERLFPLVYAELRAIAAVQMRAERAGHTLQPTALVHELFLRLDRGQPIAWNDRGHFFRLAAQAMRRLLVDFARRRLAERRGGDFAHVTLGRADEAAAAQRPEEVLAMDEALERLGVLDPRQAQVVELRAFSGMTMDEIAAALGLSLSTVEREWRAARAWLRRELAPAGSPGSG